MIWQRMVLAVSVVLPCSPSLCSPGLLTQTKCNTEHTPRPGGVALYAEGTPMPDLLLPFAPCPGPAAPGRLPARGAAEPGHLPPAACGRQRGVQADQGPGAHHAAGVHPQGVRLDGHCACVVCTCRLLLGVSRKWLFRARADIGMELTLSAQEPSPEVMSSRSHCKIITFVDAILKLNCKFICRGANEDTAAQTYG
jgi:hypothetical protein